MASNLMNQIKARLGGGQSPGALIGSPKLKINA